MQFHAIRFSETFITGRQLFSNIDQREFLRQTRTVNTGQYSPRHIQIAYGTLRNLDFSSSLNSFSSTSHNQLTTR